MADRMDKSSSFSSPAGIGVLGIGAVLACYFKIYALGGTLFFLMLIFFLTWLWGRYSLERLEVHMSQGTWNGFPGEEICLVCRVKNNKFLPLLWLELSFAPPKNGCIDGNLKRRIFSVRWQEELEFSMKGKALHRGAGHYMSVTAASGDGFGLGEKEKEIPLKTETEIIVYPEIYAVDTGRLMNHFSDVQQGEKGYIEDISLLKMNRSYEPQDPVKKINWRQLAGSGRLTSNVYETMLPRTVTFVLDLGAFREEAEDEEDSSKKYWRPLTEELEQMLSFAASCVVDLLKEQASCRIVLPGQTSFDEEMRESWDSSEEGLLTLLAEVEYHGETRLFKASDAEELEIGGGILFVISRDWEHFTGKEVFPANEQDIVFLGMHKSKDDVFCPWHRMYAEEFICKDGESVQ